MSPRPDVVVVGSGASGVHYALTALEKGRRVLMLDIGFQGPPPPDPEKSLTSLKTDLDDPVDYFLGEEFESLILPGADGEYYGFPPAKDHVFRGLEGFERRVRGFAPLFSFAAGGLAEAWTGGCYPFNEADLAEFPFDYKDLLPYYERVSRRIGIAGEADDLSPFLPGHGGLQPPLELDEHSATLLRAYEKKRNRIQGRYGAYLGRARSAVLSRDLDGRPACTYLGRCLWGCPTRAFYTPLLTLERCMEHPDFEYRGGMEVTRFTVKADRIEGVVVRPLAGGAPQVIPAPVLALAAGTLSTTRILLQSVYSETGTLVSLPGLMDNRQVLMPFVNTKLVGRKFDADRYQYHQLAVALAEENVHVLITTLKTAMIQPIAQSMPFSLATSLALLRNAHAALGLLNVNFADRRRPENHATLDEDGALVLHYHPETGESSRIARTAKKLRRIFRDLGCIVPKPMQHIRPMGASVHYAGTVPMTREGGPFTSDEYGRSRDYENLVLVDGSTFPSLPAKNLTFTLMANATRIADQTL